MPLKTPFRLLIRFIYNFTNRYYSYLLHCYLFTQLTCQSLQFIRSSFRLFSLSLKHLNGLQLFFTYELPVTVLYRELLCSADGLEDNPSARTLRKTLTLLLEPFPSNGGGTDLQKTR
jgi:hypothetical protein